MASAFASQGDMAEKQKSLTELAEGVYAYTAEGDPNSGFVVGDRYVLVFEAQATPLLAKEVIAQVRTVTDKPIRYLVLSHYHAVRVLGASAYQAEEVVMSQKTYEMVQERGKQDWDSEFQRFPRLFKGHETIPGLTWPTLTFTDKLTVDLGNKKVVLWHIGEGHTRGDTIAWLPEERVCLAGDLVEYGATPYCGDAQLKQWPLTLQRLAHLAPQALIPGRGDAIQTPTQCLEAIYGTAGYVTQLYQQASLSVAAGDDLKTAYDKIVQRMTPQYGEWVIFEHCMPFNVKRAYDEASGITHPEIWTDVIDMEMWKKLNG